MRLCLSPSEEYEQSRFIGKQPNDKNPNYVSLHDKGLFLFDRLHLFYSESICY